eukprot:TRINITY_DN43544_c0_g1_i1.p1 TRINITY_DN43544_c0_g1~~TRINITY_DN43544_c0_g1_i1.p1  ORF type:complete len:903 (+),score=87.00 TRINITY_DN43544_c0_g1_i1:52-2709(+)
MADASDGHMDGVLFEGSASCGDACSSSVVAIAGAHTSGAAVRERCGGSGDDDEKLMVAILSDITDCLEANLRMMPRLVALRPDLAERPNVRRATAKAARGVTAVATDSVARKSCVFPADHYVGHSGSYTRVESGDVANVFDEDVAGETNIYVGLNDSSLEDSVNHSRPKVAQKQRASDNIKRSADFEIRDPVRRSHEISFGISTASVNGSAFVDGVDLASDDGNVGVDHCSGESFARADNSVAGMGSTRHTNQRSCGDRSKIELWPMFSVDSTTDTNQRVRTDVTAVASTSKDKRRCSFVINPRSRRNLTKDLLSAIVVIYELVTIPLMAFEFAAVDGPGLPKVLFLYTTLHWTFELIANFFIGFHTHTGSFEERYWHIARQYMLRGWFFFDVILVIADWILIYMSFHEFVFAVRVARLSHLSRVTRLLKVLRILHLARIFKLTVMVSVISESMFKSLSIACMRIFEGLLGIFLFCHCIGCLWYELGKADYLTGSSRTWMKVLRQDLEIDANTDILQYWYFVCLHFSFALFTPMPPPLGISPSNYQEQLYIVVVFLIGFVCFTIFASSVTSSILVFRTQVVDSARQTLQFRQFLHDHEVSVSLNNRILVWFRDQRTVRKVITLEADIPVLQKMPVDMIRELRFEIYHKALLLHPLFEIIFRCRRECLQCLCQSAISQRVYRHGELVFEDGDPATHMMFVHPPHKRGKMRTVLIFLPAGMSCLELEEPLADQFDSSIQSGSISSIQSGSNSGIREYIHENEWFGEPALWNVDCLLASPRDRPRPWRREGSVHTLQFCCITALCGTEFRRAISMDAQIFHLAQKYAQKFAQLQASTCGSRDMFRSRDDFAALAASVDPYPCEASSAALPWWKGLSLSRSASISLNRS